MTSLASDYERSKKDAVLTPQNLLDFEILDRERIGSSHSARLKELFGVDQLPDDLNELVVPTDEEQKEARRQKYLEEAKRFKRQQDIKLAEEEALADLTSDDDKMLQEMIRYEEDRKKYYENEFSELLHIHQDIMDREKTLEDEIRISYSVVMNINEIKEHPTEVFTKIQDFREGVELNKKRAEEEQKMKEEQEKLIMEAKKQKEEAEKKLLTEEEKEKEGKGAGEA